MLKVKDFWPDWTDTHLNKHQLISSVLLELQLLKLQILASEKKGTPIGETIGKKVYHKYINKNIDKNI